MPIMEHQSFVWSNNHSYATTSSWDGVSSHCRRNICVVCYIAGATASPMSPRCATDLTFIWDEGGCRALVLVVERYTVLLKNITT